MMWYIPVYTTEDDDEPELEATDVTDDVEFILLIDEFLVGGGGGGPPKGAGGKGPKF